MHLAANEAVSYSKVVFDGSDMNDYDERAPLPRAQIAARSTRARLREMRNDLQDWSAERAQAVGRAASRAAPAVFTAVFIGAVSVGIGVLADGKGSSNSYMELQNIQYDLEQMQRRLDAYQYHNTYLDNLHEQLQLGHQPLDWSPERPSWDVSVPSPTTLPSHDYAPRDLGVSPSLLEYQGFKPKRDYIVPDPLEGLDRLPDLPSAPQ